MKHFFFISFALAVFIASDINAQNYYDVKDFTGLVISETIKAEVTLGDSFSVELKGEQEAIDELVVELRGQALVVRPKISWKSWQRTYPDANVTALITMPKINVLVASGAGEVGVEGLNVADNLTITVSGSAKVTMESQNKNTTIIMSGGGNCNLEGTAIDVSVTMSGSGQFKGENYRVKNLTSFISGRGSVYTHVQNLLKATFSGSGLVYYKGDPDVKVTKVMGTGNVQKLD